MIDLLSAPLPDRSLPSLSRALLDPAVPAVAPEENYPVPEELVDGLDRARKILIVGHVPPDGDCVGSAIGLSRALRALGKEAHACVDDVLPGNLRRMDGDHAHPVKRVCELDADYDLVIVVDVAAANRIGDAARAAARAPEVMVIDHHQVKATREALGMKPETPLIAWVEADADSASLLVAGAIAKLIERHPERRIGARAWREIAVPLAIGAFTDTDGFTRPGATMAALESYKYLVHHRLGGNQTAVRQVLAYHLPRTATSFLRGPLRPDAALRGADRRALRERLRALAARGVQKETEYSRDRSTALLIAPKELTRFVLDVARAIDPDTTMNDVRGALLHELDQLPKAWKLAVLLFESDEGVLVSARSQDPGPALAIARAVAAELGGSGDGHLHMAGATPDADLAETAAMVRRWLIGFARFNRNQGMTGAVRAGSERR